MLQSNLSVNDRLPSHCSQLKIVCDENRDGAGDAPEVVVHPLRHGSPSSLPVDRNDTGNSKKEELQLWILVTPSR
jgi:hypothetical protein